MKILYPILPIAFGIALVSCVGRASESTTNGESPNADNATDPSKIATELVQYTDSALYSNCRVTIKYSVAFPTGNGVVEDSLRYAMLSVFDTEGNLDLKTVMKHSGDSLIVSALDDFKDLNDLYGNAEDFERNGRPIEYEYDTTISISYDSDKIVTASFSHYTYTGGVHGLPSYYSFTFLKNNGQRFNWDMIRPASRCKLIQLIKEGLAEQYFEIASSELSQYLLLNESEFTLPSNPPYIMADGVHFIYQPYEITPYAAGMPECVISFEDIKPILTTSGQAFI